MSIDVVVAGGCTVDVVHATDGSTAGRQPGGSALYAGVGARIWGLRPGVVALRGTGLPDGWDDLLEGLGFDLDGLVSVPHPVPVNEFFYKVDGTRTQRPWSPEGRGTPMPHLRADLGEPIRHVPLLPAHVPARYRQARGAHLAPMTYPVQRDLIESLAAVRALTLDPYPHVMAERPDTELNALLRPLAAFLPSEEEVTARFPGVPLEEVTVRLSRLGARVVVIKRGPLGSHMYDSPASRHYAIPALPVGARDPTGAGDAFCGGFLAGLVLGGDSVHAALCGTVAASFVVEDFWFRAAMNADPAERDRRYAWVQERVQ